MKAKLIFVSAFIFISLVLHGGQTATLPVDEDDNDEMICIPKKNFTAMQKKAENVVCTTPNCARTASYLIEAMRPDLDPCKDFNEFVCSDFRRRHPVAEDDLAGTSTWTLFNSYFNLQLQDAIENLNPDKEPYIVREIQEMYHVCINNTYQPEAEFKAFEKLMKDVYEWPIAIGPDWKPTHSSFIKFLENIESKGMPNPLLSFQFSPLENDTKTFIVIINTNSLITFVDAETEEAKKMEEAAYELIRNVAKEFGNKDSESIESDIRKMKEASAWMQNRLATELENVEETEVLLKISELTNMFRNKIDWISLFDAKVPKEAYIFKEHDRSHAAQKKMLFLLIDAVEELESRTLYNLFGWHALLDKELINYSGSKGEKILEKYLSANPNHQPEAKESRGLACTKIFKEKFPMIATRIFVNKYVDKKDKAIADELIQHIQTAYRNNIEQCEWLDEVTKKRALTKSDKIIRHVAYPNFLFDDEKLNAYHTDVPKVESTEFLNYFNRIAYQERRKIIAFTFGREDKRWTEDPLEVNAAYISITNSIWFPTAILQLPFFDGTRLAAINFGGVGASIGHEIGHGFDVSGSRFNEDGKLENWWSDETGAIYEDKTKCFIKQYNEFCPEALKGNPNETFCVDGTKTLGENMADLTGLNAAFAAYKLWVEKHGEEKRLPGLTQFTPEQLFFISYAYVWCENIPPDIWHQRFMEDVHSPGEYRINGVLANNEDFRRVFNCPLGKMNRGKDSCSIW